MRIKADIAADSNFITPWLRAFSNGKPSATSPEKRV
jgi:hypothetical protein